MMIKMKIKNFFSSSNNNKQIHSQRNYERVNVSLDIVTKAEEGDTAAQLELGKVYYNTTSVEKHDTIAFDWIHRAAEQGNMEAQFKLGDMYALGYGTTKNISESYKWYTKAAIQGHKRALIRIHNLYQQDIKMRCRGKINSEEKECDDKFFKKDHNVRELYEYRLEQNTSVLNGAIEYYTHQFKHYRLSEQKDPISQLNLGFLYEHGYGVKKCSRWAFEYYSLAAEQGNIDAQYNLGRLYQKHTDKKFNYRHAFKWYSKSAQSGNISAQRCLAYFYLKGLATDINYDEAIYWYTKASEAGDSQAQVTLGMLYRKGDYIQQDLAMAAKWYTLAARQGNIVAKNCLSQLYQRDMLLHIDVEEDMLEYLTEDSMKDRLCSKLMTDVSKLEDLPEFYQLNKLAKHALIGDGPAMYEIGLKYYHGNKEFPQNKDTGIKWIKNAANREHQNAQLMMAKLYKEGDSVEQDYYKSCIWYKTIAKRKDADAQCQVGIMYKKGHGVRKDPLEASKWFTWATEQESSQGQFHFGLLRLYGEGIRKDKKEAKKWFFKSIRQRNTQVCFEVAKIMFDSHIVIEDNLGTSLKLFEFATRHGCIDAQLYMGDMYNHSEVIEQDLSKCIEYYTMAANSGDGHAQYQLAILYLHGDGINHDYMSTYSLFKQAKEKGHEYANWLFQIPIKHDKNIKNYSKVIEIFTEVTKTGIDDLSFHIGSIYENGVKDDYNVLIINTNYDEAEKWYLVASNKGDSRADYRLGIMDEYGKGVQKNIISAIKHYRNAMKKENTDAIYRLACKYLSRLDIFHDSLKAFHLYTTASNMGHKKAVEALMAFEYNEVTTYNYEYNDKESEIHIDRKKLINMLEKTTKEGYTQLQYQLGVMYERNNDSLNAFKWLSSAADIGISDAYYRLGVMYQEGRCMEQDYGMASSMYQKATDKDHDDACFRLGRFYQYGDGVKLDYLKAYSFYKKAAEMGHEMASKVLNITQRPKLQANGDIRDSFYEVSSKEYQDSLIMCKHVAENGDTEVQFKIGFASEYNYLKPDYSEALKWYSMAAKKAHREAMYHLGLLYEKGLGVPYDYQKAIYLYKVAYQLGSYDAVYRLGVVYHHGRGVSINPVKAVEFYTLSAEDGKPEYQCELGRLYEEGELVPKNLLEALKWYTKSYDQGYNSIGSKLCTMYEDKPYESFFYEKLFRNLLIASSNYFGLTERYEYEHLGDINNRLGSMYFYGQGTQKNLITSLYYFLKEYSDKTRTSIKDFGFFQYRGFSFSQKLSILKEFEDDQECMDQLRPNELYILGMTYYDKRMERFIWKQSEEKPSTPIENSSSNSLGKHNVLKEDHIKSLKYLKASANENHPEALFYLGMMYYCGHGVQQNSEQGDEYFNCIPHDNIDLIGKIAILYHTHDQIQNFSKALEYYNRVEKRLIANVDTNKTEQIIGKALVQSGLGLLYEYGDGVKQDYLKALEYYKKLGEDKNVMGYHRLGLLYYYGKGVPLDYKKAFDYFNESTKVDSFNGYNMPYVYEQTDSQKGDGSRTKLVYCTKKEWDIKQDVYYYLSQIRVDGQGISKTKKRRNILLN